MPRLVLTAVITTSHQGEYTARVETLYRGYIRSQFEIGDSDGCHLPQMKVGQRVALVAGLTTDGNEGTTTPGRFSDFSGPIWFLDRAGHVVARGTYPISGEPYIGPPINALVPQSLADILLQGGLPDAATRAPAPQLATTIGTTFLFLAFALSTARYLLTSLGHLPTRARSPDRWPRFRGIGY
jgi:hypothetical protein